MTGTTILGIAVPSTDPVFLGVVTVHAAFGFASAISGAVAMLANKGRGHHSTAGVIYFWCMAGVFATMTTLAVIRWAEDRILFALGLVAFALVGLGRLAIRRQGNLRIHAICMGMSYIVMLTAFYVDNGKSLPVWKDLPPIAYWIAPALVGVPLILRTLARHPLLRRHNSN